jgi:hypothetical protein
MFYKILQFLGLKPKSDWVVVRHVTFKDPDGHMTLLVDKNNKHIRKMVGVNLKSFYYKNSIYTRDAYYAGKEFVETGIYMGHKLEVKDEV